MARTGLTSPVDLRWFKRAVLRWYAVHDRAYPWRLAGASDFQRVAVEILLQRTRADVVGSFTESFFRRFQSWGDLARASQSELEDVLRPIGLWRSRAQRLQGLAQAVVTTGGKWPASRDALEQLPGVGQYVASSVLLFVHGRPEPLLDAGMARLLERFFGPRQKADIRYDPYLQALAREVVRGSRAEQMNWALLDLSALVCTKRPECARCPLAPRCRHGQSAARGS